MQACMASFVSPTVFSLLAFLLFSCHQVRVSGQPDSGNNINAIYSLGDSIADTGNLVNEGATGSFETIAHLPYGETLGYPTGRCSDGLLMIDFLAQDLGLPFLNPFLAKNESFDHGVNFAVAGATALDTTDLANRSIFVPYTTSSLKVQLKWFKDFMKSRFNKDEDIRKRLQISLVFIGEIGGNDYNYAFFTNKTMNEVEKLIPDVVQTIIDAAKEVLDMGANKIFVPGNFPIGCTPGYLAMINSSEPLDYDSMGCLRGLNLFAAKHNLKLQQALLNLQLSYPNAKIAYADYFNAFLNLLRGATSLGFDTNCTHMACCGAGGNYNYNAKSMCGAEGTTTCQKPSTYVSWDGIHLTQAAYKAMSRLIFHGRYLQPQILNF